jgi:hypothetical protein
MKWVVWRQHRAEALWAVVLLALLAVLLVLGSRGMFAAYQQIQQGTSVASCAHAHSQDPVCDALTSAFRTQFGAASILLLGLVILPALAGMFLGAPLVAREVERGTQRLAWTQGITRTRWMLAQVGALVLGTALLFGAFSVLLMWWRGPLDQVAGDRFASGFDLEGAAPVAYALFALALGIAAGVLVRRTVPAMAASFVGFVAVRGVVEFVLRPQYLPPVARITDPTQGNPTPYNGDWVFNNGFAYLDRAGHMLSAAQALSVCGDTAKGTTLGFMSCRQDHGIRYLNHYQPASRFWLFQGIESSLFLVLALALLALAVWWVRARLAK